MGKALRSVEQRRHARLSVSLPAKRRTSEGTHEERVINLSTGGLALLTGSRLNVGSWQQLDVAHPQAGLNAHLQAEVVRVQEVADSGQFIVGMKFRVLDAETTAHLEGLMLRALSARSGMRSSPRLEVRHEVFWSSPGYKSSGAFELMNVSTTGALLAAGSLPDPQSIGLLSLRAAGADELLAVPARVVWRRDEGQQQLAGVRFANDPQAMQLVHRIVRTLLFQPPRPSQAESPGTRIGEYELGGLAFRGPALEIYRATRGGQPVALKRFRGSPPEVEAWARRFLIASSLGSTLNHHPGVVSVHAAIADAEECWLASEWVEAPSLEQRMIAAARDGQRLEVDEVLRVASEVLSTLEDCHWHLLDDSGKARQVLHGDLRAGNIFCSPQGARLAGFGAPFELRAERLPWSPPEILEGRAPGPSSDVYQLAVVLYEALTGVLPFRGDTAQQVLVSIADGPRPLPALNPKVPKSVDGLIRQALSFDSEARPSSALALAEALSRIDLDAAVTDPGLIVPAGPRPSAPQLSPPRPRPRLSPPSPRPLLSPPKRSSQPAASLNRGDRVGRYEIVGKLAQGGMAELFVARTAESPWPVVLKTLQQWLANDGEVATLFMNEARLMSQLKHPNIVRITDVGFDGSRLFIALEYFASRTLADVLDALKKIDRVLPPRLAAYITCEAAAGLECAHTQRDTSGRPMHIVHRDVTARNLLLGYEGTVKVVDFGLARSIGMARLTTPGFVRGTASWLSPEQIQGRPVTAAADVWALGVNLYLMLSGQMPFVGKTPIEVLQQVLKVEPPGVRRLRPEIPAELAEVLPRALAKSEVDRYPSAQELRDEALASVGDPRTAAVELAGLLETLFPRRWDPERVRLAELAPEGVMPGDAPSPLSRLMGWLRK